MERWKYFDITHHNHVFCNPLSTGKVDDLIEILRLNPGARVLDIACGKAEFLARTAERWQVRGVGVDLSPFCVRNAREKAKSRGLENLLQFVEQDGKDFDPGPDPYDLTSCIGASWTFGGHAATLTALQGCTRSGGLVVAGEPFWRHEPPPEYIAARGGTRDSYASSHAENVSIGESLGLRLLYTMVSSEDDWDRYEGLQWQAAERYAMQNPQDPDVPELLERVRRYRDAYLSYGRDILGWATYVFANEG